MCWIALVVEMENYAQLSVSSFKHFWCGETWFAEGDLVLHLIKVERPACSDGGAGEDGGD
jgi:hypothetical protein